MKRKHKIELIIVSIIILALTAVLVYQFRFNRKFLYEQARTLYEQGDKDRAVKKYEELLRRFSRGSYTDRARYDLARMHYEEKNYEKAIPYYKEFLRDFPGSECFGQGRTELTEMQQALKDIGRHIAELHDGKVQGRAAAALAKTGKPAINALMAALKDENSSVREQAASVLGRIGDASVVDPLVAALKDRDWSVRMSAASNLGRLKEPPVHVVEALIPLLRDKHYQVQWTAEMSLAQIGLPVRRTETGEPALGPLRSALKDEDSSVRMGAAGALGQIGDARAVEPLIAALSDDYWAVQWKAAEALGKIGDARAVTPLIAALSDESPEVRKLAATALGKINDTRAIDPLIAMLKDEDFSVRWKAGIALSEIGWRPEGAAERAYWLMSRGEWDKLPEIAEPAVEPLIGAISENVLIGKKAVKALVKIGSPSVGPLIKALSDKHAFVRESAAAALGGIKDPRAIGPLITALKDYAADEPAVAALAEIGGPAVEPLISALNDGDFRVRGMAAWALGQIGDKRAVEPLIVALRDWDVPSKGMAAMALGMLKDVRAVQPLRVALKDNDPSVRWSAAVALNKIGWQPKDDIQRAYYLALKQEWDKLPEMGAQAVEPLLRALTNADGTLAQNALKTEKSALKAKENAVKARQNALKALRRIGESSICPLLAALKSGDWPVRRIAAEALAMMKDDRAVAPLLEVLRHGNLSVRWVAADTLVEIGWRPKDATERAYYLIIKEEWDKLPELGEPAVEPLISALSNTTENTRWEVIEALAEIGEPAIEPLISALEDGYGVSDALRVIGGDRALKPLITALKRGNPGPAIALGKIGDPSAVEPLIAVLKRGEASYLSDCAGAALSEITGRDFGPDHPKWQEWWEQNKAKYLKDE